MQIFEREFCLYCQKEIRPLITWESLFLGPEEPLLCEPCTAKLERIEGKTCRICGRPFSKIDDSFKKGDICLDCYRWEENAAWRGVLTRNISLYMYNDFIKDVLARYKYRGDYELVRIFVPEFNRTIARIEYDLLVPIPLSSERLYERGFNQTEALIQEAGRVAHPLLKRIHSEKQAKKSRSERIQSPNVFTLNDTEEEAKAAISDIEGKTILLIDDIYTTGTTLRQAATVLRQAGAEKVLSLTIARG
ncbi:MAG: ComF family protein [Caldibacillus sp.]